jgi:hypothetical protein
VYGAIMARRRRSARRETPVIPIGAAARRA